MPSTSVMTNFAFISPFLLSTIAIIAVRIIAVEGLRYGGCPAVISS